MKNNVMVNSFSEIDFDYNLKKIEKMYSKNEYPIRHKFNKNSKELIIKISNDIKILKIMENKILISVKNKNETKILTIHKNNRMFDLILNNIKKINGSINQDAYDLILNLKAKITSIEEDISNLKNIDNSLNNQEKILNLRLKKISLEHDIYIIKKNIDKYILKDN